MAIQHINRYGSHHRRNHCRRSGSNREVLNEVDGAIVMVNFNAVCGWRQFGMGGRSVSELGDFMRAGQSEPNS
jgi:gamma-glutamyl phosphate reductase